MQAFITLTLGKQKIFIKTVALQQYPKPFADSHDLFLTNRPMKLLKVQ